MWPAGPFRTAFPVIARARFLVSGRVQAVGFRWFTQKAAVRLGLTGWVRNLPDGRVEAVAQGLPEAIEAFEEALKSGPRFARVEDVEKVNDPHDTNTYKSFDII